MPDLLSRAITLSPFRRFAAPSAKLSRLHIRHTHGIAAACDQSLPVDDDGPPLRLRKHGFKGLPLSPLMRGWNATPVTGNIPPPADEELKEFQKEVAMNPYAQALATPVRYCSLTLAHLPSHFLLPFTTVVEKAPATDAGQQPQVKARIQPGRSSDYSQETLAQTSYIINRQDAVRHLSRKRHWTFLILERQKTKLASIAHRSPDSQKLVQDLWVWDNQVDAMTTLLEKRIVAEARRMSRTATSAERNVSLEEQAPELKFVAVGSGDSATELSGEASITMYDLSTLLSSEALDSITNHAAQVVTEGVWKAKGPHAWRIVLAIEKLKSYKASNEIQKQLPMAQNPPGTRKANQQRLLKLGARSEEEEL